MEQERIVLDEGEIERAITRIAHEILEAGELRKPGRDPGGEDRSPPLDADAERAGETGHSTARQAAELAG
ncbi:MAG: hypothetical protein ACKOTA_08445, partial [Solirubrobacterales bacterium]